MLTGCRLSEIQKLYWEQVDLEAGELKLPNTKTGAKVVNHTTPIRAVQHGAPDVTSKGTNLKMDANEYECMIRRAKFPTCILQ